MIAALAYLQFHSTKNRLLFRLRRLKKPKYLIGAIAGGLYFYFYFFRCLFMPRPRVGPDVAAMVASPEAKMLTEGFAALLLFAAILLAWVWPSKRAALTFTEAEVAILFPAPITRRGLIHFRLLRSQTAILFTSLIFALVANRWRSGGVFLHVMGWWIILVTLQLHRLGSSFTLTMLLDRGIAHWLRRLIVLALMVAGAAFVLVWGWRALPAPDFSNGVDAGVLRDYASQLLTSGPLPYLLYPFRLVVQPYQAADWAAFALALWPAVLLLALHYVWVTRMDVAFEEASLEVSRKLAERVAAVREGRHLSATPKKAKRPPFQLRPTGPPAVGLLWKNLISAGQGFSLRFWLVLVAVGVAVCVALGQMPAKQGVLPAIGLGSVIIAAWLALFGPHVARMDFRQDLPNADILKAWPLRGWQVVLGETLAPAAVLAAVQWFLILVALILLGTDNGRSPLAGPFSVKLGAAFGAALLLPALNVISLLIINAAVLLFPAWLQSGREGPQGIEATGQRLIFALGQLVAFTLALAPAAGVFAAVFFIGRWALPLALTLPLAAVGGTIVLGLESALGVMLVGKQFDRLDLSAETNP